MYTRVPFAATLMVLLCANAFAQQQSPKTTESHKYRTLLTLAGGGGGLALGFYIGFRAFDDAVNSDRKVLTTAAISAAGGAVGGYFLGRHLDERGKKTGVKRATDELYRALIESRRQTGTAGLVFNRPQKTRLPISLSSSLTAMKPGSTPPMTLAEFPCELSHLYLRAALQQMILPE
jgi:hypothetical protein